MTTQLKQLSFMDDPVVAKTAIVHKDPQDQKPTVLEELNALKDLIQGEAPPHYHDEKFYQEATSKAVLEINQWQRQAEAQLEPQGLIQSLIRAQDWLCRDLPEWMHWVLREL